MYKLKRYDLNKEDGSYVSFIKETMANISTPEEREEAKDLIFRLTYPWALNYVSKFKNLGEPEDFSGDMSIAFMKTFNNYDPDREGTSFLQYYKLAMRCEIINNYYGKYRGNEKDKSLLVTAKNLMTSLDEPLYNKEEKETGTKKDLLVDEEVDFDKDIFDAEFKQEIRDLAWEAIQSKNHKKVSEEVYMYYIDLLLADEFISYAEIARKLGKSLCNVRKIVLCYNEILGNLLKERGIF